jgi:hypothetical protein
MSENVTTFEEHEPKIHCLLGSATVGGNRQRNTGMIEEQLLEEEEEEEKEEDNNLKTSRQRKRWRKLVFLKTYTRL